MSLSQGVAVSVREAKIDDVNFWVLSKAKDKVVRLDVAVDVALKMEVLYTRYLKVKRIIGC